MLKDLCFAGAYYDEGISVSVALKNPADYGYDASVLLFSVMLRAKNADAPNPYLDDFTFYVMDESHRLYNTQTSPYAPPVIADAEEGEITRRPDGLFFTDFKPEFLFQDLRVAFYYRPCMRLNIITLRC